MAIAKFDRTVTLQNSGAVAESAEVLITTLQGSQATLYSNLGATTTIDNPITTPADGRVSFFIEEGSYNITVTYSGVSTSYNNIPIYPDPAEKADSDDLGSLGAVVGGHTSDIATLQNTKVDTSTFNSLEQRVTDVESDVSTNSTNLGTIGAVVGGLTSDVTTLQNTTVDITTFNLLSGRVDDTESDISTLETGLSSTNTQLGSLGATVGTHTTQITTLQNTTVTNANFNALVGRVDTVESDISTLDTGLSNTNTQLGSLGATVGNHTTQITTLLNTTVNTTTFNALEGRVDDAETDISALQTGLSSTDTQLGSLGATVGTHTSQIATLQNTTVTTSSFNTLEGRVTDVEDDLVNTNSTVGTLGLQVGQLNSDVTVLQNTTATTSYVDTMVASMGFTFTGVNISTSGNDVYTLTPGDMSKHIYFFEGGQPKTLNFRFSGTGYSEGDTFRISTNTNVKFTILNGTPSISGWFPWFATNTFAGREFTTSGAGGTATWEFIYYSGRWNALLISGASQIFTGLPYTGTVI